MKKLELLFNSTNLLTTIIWLIFAWYAIFIAYPEYKEFTTLNNLPNLNWNWEIEFETLESSYIPYIWDKNLYSIFLIWDKNNYIWKWERIKLNWVYLNSSERDRLELNFYLRKNNIYWLFDLFWKQRKTDWNFELLLSDDNKSFTWFFQWNAAESKWLVIWKKITSELWKQ